MISSRPRAPLNDCSVEQCAFLHHHLLAHKAHTVTALPTKNTSLMRHGGKCLVTYLALTQVGVHIFDVWHEEQLVVLVRGIAWRSRDGGGRRGRGLSYFDYRKQVRGAHTLELYTWKVITTKSKHTQKINTTTRMAAISHVIKPRDNCSTAPIMRGERKENLDLLTVRCHQR